MTARDCMARARAEVIADIVFGVAGLGGLVGLGVAVGFALDTPAVVEVAQTPHLVTVHEPDPDCRAAHDQRQVEADEWEEVTARQTAIASTALALHAADEAGTDAHEVAALEQRLTDLQAITTEDATETSARFAATQADDLESQCRAEADR